MSNRKDSLRIRTRPSSGVAAGLELDLVSLNPGLPGTRNDELVWSSFSKFGTIVGTARQRRATGAAAARLDRRNGRLRTRHGSRQRRGARRRRRQRRRRWNDDDDGGGRRLLFRLVGHVVVALDGVRRVVQAFGFGRPFRFGRRLGGRRRIRDADARRVVGLGAGRRRNVLRIGVLNVQMVRRVQRQRRGAGAGGGGGGAGRYVGGSE